MKTRRLVRSDQWWTSKVPPLIAIAAIVIGAWPGPAPARAIGDLVALLVSVVGIAAFGHLLNDWCDLEADARGGKPNRLADTGLRARTGLVAVAASIGLLPWLVLPHRPAAWVAVGVELVLLTAYSLPPLRLKGRGWIGAVADASYAFAVPFAIVVLALGPEPAPARSGLILGSLVVWGVLLGLRGILWHQLGDIEADRSAGTGTVPIALGVRRTELVVARVLLPLELVALAVVLASAGTTWLLVLVACFLPWRLFQMTFLWSEPIVFRRLRDDRYRVECLGFHVVNEFIERWLPLAALVAVAWSSPWWWAVAAVHLVVFPNALRTFVAWDLWMLPDAIERMAFSRQARRDARLVEKQRIDRLAQGPDHLEDPTARRWVFVVCGPLSHLETLGTALRHLRPLTEAEIWVITDSRRNALPIEAEGIDRLVDVATPVELDDHQASIWLKTSVHRHLPPGEWCYLDSDIIAVAPGMEGVFDERGGPVAFASDITIRENSVDRFSPWAMSCPCLGYDDEHSCGHLREQLTVRFGLDVPGDWLHWNGGVFVFGNDSYDFLDMWHERAVASFSWPEWKTRDQGALISTVWTMGLQDLPRLSPTFNFIADLGNADLCLDPVQGWAHHPSGPWYDARLLHLYTSALEDPAWSLNRDVEAVVVRRSRVRIYRWRRAEVQAAFTRQTDSIWGWFRNIPQSRLRWGVQDSFVKWGRRARHLPTRLTPTRIRASLRRRTGAVLEQAEPQREPSLRAEERIGPR